MPKYNSNINSEEKDLIELHEKILKKVREAIVATMQEDQSLTHKYVERFLAAREAASTSNEKDIAQVYENMYTQKALASHKGTPLPSLDTPYFAHMRLEEEGRQRDILIGYVSFVSTKCDYPVIDWRHAPMAKIYFNYREGEEFDEELPGKEVQGTVSMRNMLTISNGRLVQIMGPKSSLRKSPDSVWAKESNFGLPTFKGGQGTAQRKLVFGTGQAGKIGPEVAALLDKDQYRLLNADEETPLMILGGAGSGKTTVALHRLAHLAYQDPKKYQQNQAIIIVPEPGLVRLSRLLLSGLGLDYVGVATFDDWIKAQGQRILRDLPKRVCDETPPSVSVLKRHPAYTKVLPLLLRARAQQLSETLAKELFHGRDFRAQLDKTLRQNYRYQPILPLLEELQAKYLKTYAPEPESKARIVAQANFNKAKGELFLVSQDRVDLFGNQEYLSYLVEHSRGEITPSMIDQTMRHTRSQIADTPSKRYQGIDQERLKTVDGQGIDDSTPDEIAGTVDIEDYAILLEMLRLKTGDSRNKSVGLPSYQHMIIDEAQELALIELTALRYSLADQSSLTIAGDAAQQTDSTNTFNSWQGALDSLGFPGVKPSFLKTSYRSTRPIMEFAVKALGELPHTDLKVVREGYDVVVHTPPNEGQTGLFLMEVVSELMTREPKASVAILCRKEETSIRLYRSISSLDQARLVENGHFTFTPGVDVCDVAQAKGLEFDYVILPDVNSFNYPDDAISRRTLHVAATRAIHQLWVICPGTASPILSSNM